MSQPVNSANPMGKMPVLPNSGPIKPVARKLPAPPTGSSGGRSSPTLASKTMRQMALKSRMANTTVLSLEALRILSDRSFRTVLVISNLEDAGKGFIPLEDSDKEGKILSNKRSLKHYAQMGAAAIQRGLSGDFCTKKNTTF